MGCYCHKSLSTFYHQPLDLIQDLVVKALRTSLFASRFQRSQYSLAHCRQSTTRVHSVETCIVQQPGPMSRRHLIRLKLAAYAHCQASGESRIYRSADQVIHRSETYSFRIQQGDVLPMCIEVGDGDVEGSPLQKRQNVSSRVGGDAPEQP